MNIVYCISIHELLMMYDHTTLSIFLPNGRTNCNEIILCMRTFPTAYSNYSLMEMIWTFNSIISRYVMCNC